MKHDELQQILEDHTKWLTGEGCRRANLGGADLVGASLRWTNLRGADLGGADLGGANLVGANLVGANLGGADLSEADLSGADLRWANLSGADLSEADLSGADLGGANLSECRGLVWASIGPVGVGARTTTAAWIDGEIVHFAGCFRGSRSAYTEIIRNGGWDWPADRQDVLAADLIEAIDWCENRIRRWLEAIGRQANSEAGR